MISDLTPTTAACCDLPINNEEDEEDEESKEDQLSNESIVRDERQIKISSLEYLAEKFSTFKDVISIVSPYHPSHRDQIYSLVRRLPEDKESEKDNKTIYYFYIVDFNDNLREEYV